MMKKKLSVLSALLCMLMLISAISPAASAVSAAVDGQNPTYTHGELTLPDNYANDGIFDNHRASVRGVQSAKYFTSLYGTPFVNYGEQLDEINRVIYDALRAQVPTTDSTVKSRIPFDHILNDEEFNKINIQAAAEAFFLDVPETFWFTSFSIQYDTYAVGGKNYYLNICLVYNPDLKHYSNPQSLYDQMWNSVKTKSAFQYTGGSRYDFLKQVHDELAKEITYTLQEPRCYDPVGALIDNKCVCQGYAEAFKLICDYNNIPCICVIGQGRSSPSSKGENHEWNAVRMEDGKWYFVDITWDDQESQGIMYDYYLCGLNTVDDNFGHYAFTQLHVISNSDGFKDDSGNLISLTLDYPTFSNDCYEYKAEVAQPELLSADGTSEGNAVSWSPVNGAASYNVYRKVGTGDYQKLASAIGSTSYTDLTAESGTFATYTVSAVSSDGTESTYDSNGKTSSYLLAPELKTVKASSGGVTLSWNEVPETSGYIVYRKTSTGDFEKLAAVTANTYFDSSAQIGISYRYAVASVSGSQTGERGKAVKAAIIPQVPTLNSVTAARGKLTFTWCYAVGADSYAVYRRSGNSEFAKIAEVSDKNSYVDTAVQSGIRYTYTVSAVNTDTQSAYDAAGKSAGFVNQPVLVSATSALDGSKISWNPVAGATSYNIYQKNFLFGWSMIRSVSGNATSYIDTSANWSGFSYTYSVSAVLGGFESTYDTNGLTVKYAKPKIPDKVTLSGISNAQNGVFVSWKAVSNADNYRVYYKTSTGWNVAATVGGGVTSFIDSAVTSGKTYTYTVRAFNGAGGGAYDSAGLSIKYLAKPVLKPVSNATNGIVIQWSKVGGAAGYFVYRMTSTGWQRICSTSSTAYKDTAVKSGGTYRYTVVAYRGSTRSAYDKTGVTGMFLSAPKLQSVSKTSTGLKFTYGMVTGAKGYTIYRRTANSGWSVLGTVQSGRIVTFTDTSAQKGVAYIYTARAVSGGFRSAFNNGICGKR